MIGGFDCKTKNKKIKSKMKEIMLQLTSVINIYLFVTWEEQNSEFTNRDEHLWSLESLVLLLLLVAN